MVSSRPSAMSVICWLLAMWCTIGTCTGVRRDFVYEVESPRKPKICIGTNGRMSVPGNKTTHYENLKDRYTNCTYVDGNLELTWLEDENLDLSFLQYIREVTGYVLLASVDVKRLVLPSLQIIRGRTLFKLSVRNEEFSLMVTMSKMYRLEMPALRDILAGNAGFFDNYNLCHIKTINWTEILTGPGANIAYVFNLTEPERKCPSCHPDCPSNGGCWGPGPDNCQRLSKINCSPQCHGGRCFGPEPRQCCHLFCAGGCTGPTQSDCLACRNFYDNGICKQECPSMMRYNSIKYSWEPNPDGMFAYGATCVRQCPEHLLTDSSACVRSCPANKKAKNGECVACNGPCPKTCKVKKEEIINAGNIDRFRNCTILQGSLRILQHSFDGYQDVFDNFTFGRHYPKLQPSRLEVFSNVEEITGFVNIEAAHDDFRDMGFLRRLKVIGGRFQHEYFTALYIVKTSLQSLRLKSLQKIRAGGVLIVENKNLCFADGINWKTFISRDQKSQASYAVIEKNRNATDCARDGLVCHDQCTADGCWGPGPDNCLQCKAFKVGRRCVEKCDTSLGMYQSSESTCDLCHKECDGPCMGGGPDQCTGSCKHAQDGPYCVEKCPEAKYNASGVCELCHPNCQGGCSGPNSTVGEGGCVSCQAAIVDEHDVVERCLAANESCPDGHFFEFVGPQKQGLIKSLAWRICKKCHPRCKRCTGFGFHVHVCQECVHYRNGEQCEDMCPDDFYAIEETHECLRCATECRGCHGPGQSCKKCRNYRVYLASDGSDNSSAFNCVAQCPESHPHKVFPLNGDDPYCSDEPGSVPSYNPEESITIVIVSVVVTVLILMIVIVCIVCKCRSDKKKEEMLNMAMLMSKEGLNEPLKVTNVKPNMAMLRIVKEADLRKGGILGFGAFGTVYRGVWVPDEENIKIPVAIKVLREDTGADTNKEILEEAYIMASLEHKNLLPLLAVCMTSQMMLVTQLMPLGCLVDYVRNNRNMIGSKPLLNWCTQIARGMAYLEDRRLVHRDLAARNVLVQTPSLVKITDFGLAKLLDINEEQYKAAGGKMPIKWLALECIQHRIFNHKSDVWAFGVTVWELLTYGGRPYEDVPARDVPDLLEKGERLPQPASCSIEVYMIMIKCWMLDADSRPNFRELAAEFAKMSSDPGRYLVIPGDRLMRLPSYTQQDERELMRSLAASALDSPTDVLMAASEYLNPPGLSPGFCTPGYPASSLATLDDGHSELGRRDSLRSRHRERRHTHEEPGRRRTGSAGSCRHHGDLHRSLGEMGDDDCFEPAPVAGAGAGLPANVGGMMLHLPLDEDDYLMPSNGQPADAPPAYMDLVGDDQPIGNGPSPRHDQPDGQFTFSMDNPEYHMMAQHSSLNGCLAPGGAGGGGGGSLSRRGSGRRRSSSGGGARATPPRAGPASFAGFGGVQPHPSASGGYPPLCSAPAAVTYAGAAAASAPGGGTYVHAVSAASPNAVGVPVRGVAPRGRSAEQPPHQYYNELDMERIKPPPSRRSETTV